MDNIARQLHKELDSVARPYLEQIKEIEDKAQGKKQALAGVLQDVEAKKREISSLRAKAEKALGQGMDPRQFLSQASSLSGELQELEQIASRSSGLDKEDREKIRELKAQMSREIHKAIERTQAFQKMSKSMLDSMQAAIQAKKDWHDGLQRFCAETGIDERKHWLLSLSDDSEGYQLGREISAYTYKYAPVFS